MKIKESKGRRAFLVCNYIFVGLITISCLIPILNILATSFSSPEFINAGKVGLLPKGFTTSAYQFVLKNAKFWKALAITFERVLIAVPVNVGLSILVAYPLSKDELRFPARKYYAWFFIITMVFSGGVVPTYILISKMKLMDTIWALIMPTAVNVFNTLVLMNFMRGLPGALEEASMLDGAGQWTIMTRVYLPLCKPALATITLFNLINHWNSWYDGLLYNNYVENYPLQTYLQSLITSAQNLNLLQSDIKDMAMRQMITGRNLSAAQIFISIVPIMLVYPWLQKYFTTGLVMGSVKE
ncbi:MAG: carbohydrate ABC transporter permease [Candidatus Limivivens sp.]|nr:carbohydrate ABC transporter permease [Candidatus Limivivens sp.]